MAKLRPQHLIQYDPAGAMGPNAQVSIFYDPAIKPGIDGRNAWHVADGGGWLPQSGKAPDSWDPDIAGELGLAYKAGDAVCLIGYQVDDTLALGQGAFDYQQWAMGAGEVLRIDDAPFKLARRCSERDVINWIQLQRSKQIGDLSRNWRRSIYWGKSAGFLSGAFAAFGPSRANAAASLERFAMPTRFGALMGRSCISSAPAWKHGRKLRHWSNGFGGAASTIGSAIAAQNAGTGFQGSVNMRLSSPLWMVNAPGIEHLHARRMNAEMPVWLENTGTLDWPGPWNYTGLWNALPEDHPAEAVESLRLALESLQGEFPGEYVHGTQSRFLINPAGAGGSLATDQERFEWARSVLPPNQYLKAPTAKEI